jgi:hypothetical protein
MVIFEYQCHPGKKSHNPRFCITFHIKNEPLAKRLLGFIDYGHIRYKPKNNACVLVISPVKGLKKIINLINGELRTPKIKQVHSLIDWLNKNHSTNINKLCVKVDELNKDSWLSGFIDADGNFYISHTKLENGAKKRKISSRLRIEQRMLDPITKESYISVLTQITQFLGCKLLTRKQISTGNEYYTITASSRKSLLIIINYLDKFPLLSSRYLDFQDWKKAVELILSNKHLTNEGLIKIDFLKSNMNSKRLQFNWDHLDNTSL